MKFETSTYEISSVVNAEMRCGAAKPEIGTTQEQGA